MNPEYIVLREGSKDQKATYHRRLFTEHSGKGKMIGTRSGQVVARAWRWGRC